MESLRILQVAHAFPPYVGGLAHVSEHLSRSLRDLGHEVEVVTLDPSGRLKARDAWEGIPVRRFRCLAPASAYFAPSPRVIGYLRSRPADVVHAHNVAALLVPAAYVAVGGAPRRIPFVVTPHHHEAGSLWHTRLLWRPYRPFARRIVRGSDRVHCVSAFEARAVARDFGVQPVVVPNGVAEDVVRHTWRPPEDGIVVTYAGRVEAYKRVDAVVRACAALAMEGHPATARIVGEGTARREVEALARRLGVRLEVHGFVPREDYLRLLATSNCVVNPSRYEAFSLVLAEALGIGVPVIASLPWGRIFEGQEGVHLVDGGSALEIALALRSVLRSKPRRRPPPLTWDRAAERIVREVYGRPGGVEAAAAPFHGGGS